MLSSPPRTSSGLGLHRIQYELQPSLVPLICKPNAIKSTLYSDSALFGSVRCDFMKLRQTVQPLQQPDASPPVVWPVKMWRRQIDDNSAASMPLPSRCQQMGEGAGLASSRHSCIQDMQCSQSQPCKWCQARRSQTMLVLLLHV